MNITILGSGKLGLSIAKGLVLSGCFTKLYLTRRNTSDIESWSEYKNVFVTTDNKSAVSGSDVILLCVQPTQAASVLLEIKDHLLEKHVIISTAAGFSLKAIETCIGTNHYIMRAMPNTAISVGKSMTCISCNDKGKDRIELAKALFSNLGHAIEISEDKMRAATVICASGIAFWMRLIRAHMQAGTQIGFEPEQAKELSMHTCLGAISLLMESKLHPEEEIDKVTTPKGCTIEGLNEMEINGLSASLIKGINKSYLKIESLMND